MWEFMSFSSYGSGVTSSGAVQCVLDLKMDIAGRDVLIVEDILDTGNTLQYMLKNLRSRDPKSVKTVCFTHKVCVHLAMAWPCNCTREANTLGHFPARNDQAWN